MESFVTKNTVVYQILNHQVEQRGTAPTGHAGIPLYPFDNAKKVNPKYNSISQLLAMKSTRALHNIGTYEISDEDRSIQQL